MKVVATRKVFYNGVWHDAGSEFICNEKDFVGLASAGVEKYKEHKVVKQNKSVKEFKTR